MTSATTSSDPSAEASPPAARALPLGLFGVATAFILCIAVASAVHVLRGRPRDAHKEGMLIA